MLQEAKKQVEALEEDLPRLQEEAAKSVGLAHDLACARRAYQQRLDAAAAKGLDQQALLDKYNKELEVRQYPLLEGWVPAGGWVGWVLPVIWPCPRCPGLELF